MSETSNEDEGSKAAGRRLRGKPFGIDKRFESLGEKALGEGGKARVWKARDTAARPFVAGRIVAIKVLHPQSGPDDRARLRGEGGPDRRKIKHENVVRTYALRGSDDEPFLVLEYIPGENCKRLLERHGPFGAERLVEIGTQLCRGLAALHAAGLLHRDVKPGNVMVVGDLRGNEPIVVKLIDLGIAKAADDPDHTREGGFIGTESYVPPEVALGGAATEVSDVYAVGAVLYELATGKKLSPVTWEESMQRRRAEAVPAPHLLNDSVPEWLGWLIMDAIALDAERRPRSAAAFEGALQTGEEDPTEVMTRLIGGPHEAPTNELPEAEAEEMPSTEPPWEFRVLPTWIRERVPEVPEPGTGPHWAPFLLALCAGLVMLMSLALVFSIWVLAPIFTLPPWLVLTGLVTGAAAVWILRDESRREAAAGRLRGAAVATRRGALWAWYWLTEKAPPRRPSAWPAPGRPNERDDGGRRHSPSAQARHGGHGTRRRGQAGKQAVASSLRSARTQLAGAREAAAPWVPWFAHLFFIALVAALAACIVLWLFPPLQDRVDTRPEEHQTLLTAVPLAVWGIVAGCGLSLLRRSRARPKRLLAGGLMLLVLLAAIGMLMPTSTRWLEPMFWPGDSEAQEREQAELEEERAKQERAKQLVAARAEARVRAAHWESSGLRQEVRAVEKRWVRLLRDLWAQGWGHNPEMAELVRERSDALAAQLSGWTRISRFGAVRTRAERWLVSMRRAASEVDTGECSSISLGPRGGWTDCS